MLVFELGKGMEQKLRSVPTLQHHFLNTVFLWTGLIDDTNFDIAVGSPTGSH